MIRRCHLPTSSGFKKYGARGIVVCDDWRNSFEAFIADMGKRPSLLHSIERRDNDGPYSPLNCVWATPETQAYNKRNTALLTHNGKTATLKEWAKETGVPIAKVKSRFYRNLPPDRIFQASDLIRENTDFNRGERSSKSKLTADDVREIRRLRAEDGAIMKDIGNRFGVAVTTVDAILKRRNWGWLD